jgi:hypothetical protein
VKAEGRKNIANGHHPEVQSLPEEKEEEDAEIPATHLKKKTRVEPCVWAMSSLLGVW